LITCQKGQHRIKVIIIIVLLFDTEINLGQGPGHRSRGSTWVDSEQFKDNNCYYHNFKIQLDGQSGQGPGHRLGGSIWVDPIQRMDNNNYYHSFKTRLES